MERSHPPETGGPRHLLSIDDLDTARIVAILDRAAALDGERMAAANPPMLIGKIVATLFFQPSTRTQYGFQAAVLRAGGKVLAIDPESSRAGSNWGESLEDTARVLSGFADMAVLRHPHADGLFAYAAASSIPVVNAGNGMGLRAEHPTQALIDIYTIRKALGRLEGIRILVIGGAHLRAFRSQVRALSHFQGVEIFVLCPDKFWMEYADEQAYVRKGIVLTRVAHLDDIKADVDVIYHNGITEHRSEPVDSFYALDRAKLSNIRPDSLILHAFPRVEDLSFDVDAMPQARYFEQAHNGVPVRAAIIEDLLSNLAEPKPVFEMAEPTSAQGESHATL